MFFKFKKFENCYSVENVYFELVALVGLAKQHLFGNTSVLKFELFVLTNPFVNNVGHDFG